MAEKRSKRKTISILGILIMLGAAYFGLIDQKTMLNQLDVAQFLPANFLAANNNKDFTQQPVDQTTQTSTNETSSTGTLPDISSDFIDASSARHILYGDKNGGGHKYGANKPCKSEFPQDWDDVRIIKTIDKIAANDNLDWEQQDNGYYVAETMEGTLKIRVVLDRERDDVITAYPLNVRRNYCPPSANDNYNR